MFLPAVLAALMTVAPGLVMAAPPEVPPANDFAGIQYSVTSSGTVVIFAGAREIGGNVAVCGLVWFEKTVSNTTKVIEVKFTDGLRYSIGGKALNVNSRVFKRYDNPEAGKAGVARCSVTKTPWAAAYAKERLKLTMARGRVTD